jgi:hypothetical protein
MKPRAGTQVDIAIDTLALEGLPGLDARRVAAAAERELARLLRTAAGEGRRAGPARIDVDGGGVAAAGCAPTAEGIGAALARQLYRSVWR